MRYISADDQFTEACLTAAAVPLDLGHQKQEKHLRKDTNSSTAGLSAVGINFFKHCLALPTALGLMVGE